MARNPDYDMIFNCAGIGPDGNYGQGYINFNFDIEGEWVGIGIIAGPIEFSFDIEGTLNIGNVFYGLIDFGQTIIPSADFYILPTQRNWVRWSDIGNIDFTIDRKNLAGEAPMPWAGTVYKILKLDKNVIVYGSGGVTQLAPVETVWGMKNILKVGIKSRHAVVGTEHAHLFIDTSGKLWFLSDKLERLGYEEFLSGMTNLIMSYDVINELIYICDGIKGYAYSVLNKSMGTCPVNITGVGYINGESYVISSGPLVYPAFEICSDILDVGNRNNKTIHSIEVGTDTPGVMQSRIDYSINHRSNLIQTEWAPITHEGISFNRCFGKEFKIRIKATQAVELDYIKVKGVIHDFSPIDA